MNNLRNKFADLINSIISRFRQDGKKFEVQNELKRNIPKQKQKGKMVVYIFRGLIILIIFLIISSFVKSSIARNQVQDLTDSNKKLHAMIKEKDVSLNYSPKLELFMNGFIDDFINVSDDENSDDYEKKLSKYFASGFEMPSNLNDGKSRELLSKSFYDIKNEDGQDVVRYIVKYKTTEKYTDKEKVKVKSDKKDKKDKKPEYKEKEVEKTRNNENEVLISIPTKANKGNYSIVSYPYFNSVPKNKADNENFVNIKSSDLDSTSDYPKKLDEFTNDFFKKYAENSSEDMSYLMDNPSGLNGLYDFDKVDDKVISKSKKGYQIYANVIFKDKETGFKNYETFNIHVVKKDGKYYVSNMKRTI